MASESSSTTEDKPDFAQLQKDAMAREAEKNEARNAQRKARQVRLGHVEAPKPKAKSKAKAETESESE